MREKRKKVKFASSNGRDEVTGWIYVPACAPSGIVQLVHGFGEHSRRYFHMIVALMDAGYIVAADDHATVRPLPTVKASPSSQLLS